MFLKAPLDYFRLTSRFSRARFHPVQLRWKAHNGTDYAAPHGTPIKTTASGVVERTGLCRERKFCKSKNTTACTVRNIYICLKF